MLLFFAVQLLDLKSQALKCKIMEIMCLITVFIFYFQKLVLGSIKKKQLSCIFEIKNMFG